jgi:hypothetical protein
LKIATAEGESKQNFKHAVNKEAPQSQRRAIVKTVLSRNEDSTPKVFKTVTFVDHKKSNPTALQVRIPNKYRIPKHAEKSKVNAVASKATFEKPAVKKTRTRKQRKERLIQPRGQIPSY